MNWCILLFLVTCAAALPQDRSQHVKRTVVHRRAPAVPVPPHGAVRVLQPVANNAKRSAMKPTSSKLTSVAVPVPARSPILPPVRVAPAVKHVSAIKKVPAYKPEIKTLTKAESDALQRQIQQWQIAVLGGAVPPPGPAGPPGPPGSPPSYPAGPGTIWIQVPASGYPAYPGGYPSYPGYPPYPGPPSIPPPPPPTAPQPAIPDEAVQGSVQPVPEVPPTEEGVPPQEEVPATGETPAEGTVPEEEIPTDEVAPEEEPTAPEGEVPAEEVPSGEDGAPAEEVPDGGAPTGETPSEGRTAPGGEVPAPGGEEDDKLIHCKEKRGQFSHESSCSKFYNCWDDVVVEQSCPKGLAFSEEHSYCDFPENVDCGGKDLDTPPPAPGGDGGCPSSYGSYRSKTNCSEFFICVNGEAVKFACPDSLSYNDELGVCDYPYRVECENPPAPETPPEESGGGDESAPETPSAPEEQPPAPAPPVEDPASTGDGVRGLPPSYLKAGTPCWHNNVYPLNNACSRVSVCRSGFTSILACPNGMAYDKYKLRCLPYYRVRC